MKYAVLLLLLACSPREPDESVPLPEAGWESIGMKVYRLEVPTGWIIRFRSHEAGGVTFVSDAGKEWKQ